MPTNQVRLKLLFLLAFCLACPIVGAAQTDHFPIAFDHLTAEDGLSHNTVYTLLQDQDGLIWMGTRYGLNRFDGYECKVFLPIEGDPNSLGGPTVLTLMEDRQGKIWVGHREAGISVWNRDKGRFERFPRENDPVIDWEKATVRSIYEDIRGWIWVGTAGNGAFVFDEKRQLIEHLCVGCQPSGKALSGDFIFDFQDDGRGRVWIAADGRGLSVFDVATKSVSIVNSPDTLNLRSFEKSLCLDPQGNLWVGTAGSGLYYYNMVTKRFTHFFAQKNIPNGLSHNIVTDLATDSLGQVWIATDGGGLNVFEPKTGSFQQITSSANYPQSLNTNALYHLLFDRVGNLWVGTFNGGVNIHKVFSPPFLIHDKQNEYRRLGLRSVLALKEDEAGKIWIGTDGGGLFYAVQTGNSLSLHPATIGGKRFPRQVVTCLETTENAGLWVGSYAEGLSYFDTRNGTIRNYRHRPNDANSLSHNNVWDLVVDEAGGLWIGTLGGGLNYLPPGTSMFKRFQPVPGDPNSLSSVQIVDVLLDKNGRYLWAASEDKGLNRITIADGSIVRYEQAAPDAARRLSGDNLQCIFQDRQGKIWIGTEFKGLDCLLSDVGEMLHFDTKHGLPSNMINSIEEDEEGFLWIGTQKGIVRWNPETKSFIDFGTDDNQQNNQYNPRASLRLRNGRLVFGGTNGFSVLLPSNIRHNPHPPKAVFTGLRLSGQAVPIGEWNGRNVLDGSLNAPATVVRLSYADRGIVFEFTGTDFTQPAKNKFAYQLEGFDEDWNLVGAEQHRAVYSNLKGGEYLLRVKASNSDNVWGEEARLVVVVAAPFWETWWFLVLCVVGALGISYLVVTFILEHQKAVFQEKSFKAEQEILRLQNENLEKEVEAKQSRLSASVLQSAHKNQFLADLKSQIQKIEAPASELRKVLRAIDGELNQEDYWEQFQLTFNQMHQEFVHQLQHCHPDITNNDIRLCCFIRMGLSNAEIASILNITVNGVEQSKYRLKRKMGLDKEASLNDYIKGV